MELYTGEIAELIREHGYVRTAEILADRRRAEREAHATQGDASEMSEDEWKQQVKANQRK